METKKRKGKCRHHTLIQTYRVFSLEKVKKLSQGKNQKKAKAKKSNPMRHLSKTNFLHPPKVPHQKGAKCEGEQEKVDKKPFIQMSSSSPNQVPNTPHRPSLPSSSTSGSACAPWQYPVLAAVRQTFPAATSASVRVNVSASSAAKTHGSSGGSNVGRECSECRGMVSRLLSL